MQNSTLSGHVKTHKKGKKSKELQLREKEVQLHLMCNNIQSDSEKRQNLSDIIDNCNECLLKYFKKNQNRNLF